MSGIDDGRVEAFQRGWASVPAGKPGDRTRAGIAALDEYDAERDRWQDADGESLDEADPWLDVAGADDD